MFRISPELFRAPLPSSSPFWGNKPLYRLGGTQALKGGFVGPTGAVTGPVG